MADGTWGWVGLGWGGHKANLKPNRKWPTAYVGVVVVVGWGGGRDALERFTPPESL